MKVPFLDLKVYDTNERADVHAVIDSIMDSGRVVMGRMIESFEQLLKEHCGVANAVAVSSGTDALWLALKLARIGLGDEVITSAMGWLATPNAICMNGAVPVFVDIDRDLNISPISIEKAITNRTKAILVVHYTGKPCKMDEILNIAKRHGLLVIEDVAQAFGAKYKGKSLGSLGDVGAFSMNPMKLFGGLGETGAIVFEQSNWAERARALRHNGLFQQEYANEASLNLKPDEFQCGLLSKRYPRVAQINNQRKMNALVYKELISDFVDIPCEDVSDERVYYTYMIRAKRRDDLQNFLTSKGVESKIRHPILLNEQVAYIGTTGVGHALKTPEASQARKEILCLPIHEKLPESSVVYVAECIREFYR